MIHKLKVKISGSKPAAAATGSDLLLIQFGHFSLGKLF
jgi:hypothetical protein